MALFHSKDDLNIPLLTQFYQLKVDRDNLNGGELEAWLNRLSEKEGYEYPDGDWSERHGYSPENRTQARRVDMKPLAEFHAVIRRMMNDAISSGRVLLADAEALNQSAMLSPLRQLGPLPTSEFQKIDSTAFSDLLNLPSIMADERVEIEKLFSVQEPEHIFANYQSEMADSLILALGRKPIGLRRCPGCDSVFVVGRDDQKICSARCNVRISTRKRRQQERTFAK